jgi:hypothetical protein
MKQFLYIVFLAAVIAGCSDNTETAGRESTTTVKEEPTNEVGSNTVQSDVHEVNVDTLGMAEFLALKAAQAARHSQSTGIQSNDRNDANDVNVDTVGFAEFKRSRAETAREAYEDSIRRAEIIANRRAQTAENAKTNTSSRTSKPANSKRTSKQSKSRDETVTSDQTELAKETPAPAKQKKGWSNKAKGAVIGAATGAAAGAVINKKNRGVGGVVGGVVGAATGYGIGRHKDKKDTVRKEELIQDTTDQQQP